MSDIDLSAPRMATAQPADTVSLSPDLETKYARLRTVLADLGTVLIAFSGGVDSTLLLKEALDVLGHDRVLAVLALSASTPERERDNAILLVNTLHAPYRLIDTNELSDPRYAGNPTDRCYFCKNELFSALTNLAQEVGLDYVLDGTNLDDLGDHRPGMVAASEFGIRSPLREAGLRKSDIRAISRHLGLPTWNKPAAACLASRIPYGTRITEQMLRQVDAAEQTLQGLGFEHVRVRLHGPVARIEVPANDIQRVAQSEVREIVTRRLMELGLRYVTLDLIGYRTGSLNEIVVRAKDS